MTDAPRLIVNADDLGLSEGVDRGIFAGHDRGIVTSASLMAVGPSFESAVAGLARRGELGCGVHLVLHDARPVLPPERIPALVGPYGRFPPLARALRRLVTGAVPREECEAELGAQVERVRDAGVRPTHLDSHCHLHALPSVGAIVHALGRRLGVPCARRAELGSAAELRGAPLARLPLALAITACHRRMRRRLAGGLRTPDRLLGLARSGAIEPRWLARAVATLPRGRVTELMVHPGDGSAGGLATEDHGPAARLAELEAVTSPEVAEALRRAGVRLVGYRELARC